MPVGGDKWLLKNIWHWIIHSRDSFKNADSSSNTTEVFEWVTESFIQTVKKQRKQTKKVQIIYIIIITIIII